MSSPHSRSQHESVPVRLCLILIGLLAISLAVALRPSSVFSQLSPLDTPAAAENAAPAVQAESSSPLRTAGEDSPLSPVQTPAEEINTDLAIARSFGVDSSGETNADRDISAQTESSFRTGSPVWTQTSRYLIGAILLVLLVLIVVVVVGRR